MRLFWFSLIWLAGIIAGSAAALAVWQWLILACSCALLSLLFRRHPPQRAIFLALLILSLGATRYQASLPNIDPGHIASYNDSGCRISLTGVIAASPDMRDRYTGLRIRAQRVYCRETGQVQNVRGMVLAYASRFESFAYGDRVRASGYLQSAPEFEVFSYRDYLASQGIHSLMPSAHVIRLARRQANPILQVLYDFRDHALETVYRLFPDPEASLLGGILLGVESGISPEVRQAFNDTGTTHIIAISGFNITIVAAIFISLFGRWLGARRGALAAGLAIAFYTILVGADAAVVRAAIMGGLVLMANRLGRQTYGMASLAAAATLMTAIKPSVLWDVGFQLSFAATLGLILYAEPLQAWFVRWASRWLEETRAEQLAGPVAEFVLFTFAAQVTTLPLIAYHFRRLSLVSVLANPLILPVQPAVMVLSGLAVLLGSLWLPLGRPLAWIAWPFAAFTIRVVEFFAGWPEASIPLGPVHLPFLIGCYSALFALTAALKTPAGAYPLLDRIRARLDQIHLPMSAGLTALALAVGLTWKVALDRPDGLLHLTVLDVGAGDAVLVESPTGRFVLIDGGSSPIALSEALGRRLPLLERQLDWIVIGGIAHEQTTGLSGAVERFHVGAVLLSGSGGDSGYRSLIAALTEAATPIYAAQSGQSLELGGDARLEIVGVGEQGAILRLTHGYAQVLLLPGADPQSMDSLANTPLLDSATAVLLADGGYAAVNPAEWLTRTRTLVALLSVEAGNRRGLPSPEVLEALRGTTILRTDLYGWIELTSDGKRLWVEVEREPALEDVRK